MIVRNRSGAELFVQISHKSFRNIGLIGRPDKYSVVETLCLIHDHLITLGLNPVFDQETAKLVPYSHGQTVSRNLLGEVVDLVIVVGGMVRCYMLRVRWFATVRLSLALTVVV